MVERFGLDSDTGLLFLDLPASEADRAPEKLPEAQAKIFLTDFSLAGGLRRHVEGVVHFPGLAVAAHAPVLLLDLLQLLPEQKVHLPQFLVLLLELDERLGFHGVLEEAAVAELLDPTLRKAFPEDEEVDVFEATFFASRDRHGLKRHIRHAQVTQRKASIIIHTSRILSVEKNQR